MLRRFAVGLVTGLLVFAGLATSVSRLPGQQNERPRDRDLQRGRLGREELTVPDLRVDPQVDALLEEWSAQTKKIKRVEGRHLRRIDDFTYSTETVADGYFYVENPAKGRIDLKTPSAKRAKAGEKVTRFRLDGHSVRLETKLEENPQKLIFNGEEIWEVNDKGKTYNVIPVPKEQRGENIFDGPLPFLFGMPPEKAKARYRFKLLSHKNPNSARILVHPNWRADAESWTAAEIILNRKNYFLPEAVRLVDPAGTKESVYIFTDVEVNTFRFPKFIAGDPFKPFLPGYQRTVLQVADTKSLPPDRMKGAQPVEDLSRRPGTRYADRANEVPEALRANDVPDRMPQLVGASFAETKRFVLACRRNGITVKTAIGSPAPAQDRVNCVERQDPPPRNKLEIGQTITLVLYDKPEEANRGETLQPVGGTDERPPFKRQRTSKPASD